MSISTLCILQARMGSSRLPGKVLRALADGKSALELMLERVKRANTIDRLVVATATAAGDDPIAALCEALRVDCFRGSEADVLDRYYRAAAACGPARAVVRLTGDCPLHDPAVIDRAVTVFHSSGAAYVSNVAPPTYPDGLDVEVISLDALEKAWSSAVDPSEREHVTLYIRNHPELFPAVNVPCRKDYSRFRWTLDRPEDLDFLRAVYAHFYPRHTTFTMADIISYLESHPDIAARNSSITRNEALAAPGKKEKNS